MALSLTWFGFAAIGLLAAWGVVTLRNIMHSALCLAVALLAVAGMYLLLNAEFLAMVQILLYAGGVMVLVLFVVFLTQRAGSSGVHQVNEQAGVAALACAGLGVIIALAVKGAGFQRGTPPELPEGTTGAIGELLLRTYVFPFEVASVVLLAAMVGVVMIAGKVRD